jgi:hypothetical protein
MHTAQKTCLTPGVIASELGVPLHRVSYILKTRKHIQPMARAAGARVYPLSVLAQVRYELNRIAANRQKRN